MKFHLEGQLIEPTIKSRMIIDEGILKVQLSLNGTSWHTIVAIHPSGNLFTYPLVGDALGVKFTMI